MELKKLLVKNFRNFKEIEVSLTNKNVIFGMNDVGKTNLMYALRFLLDRDIRKNGFKNTDFYKNDISGSIEITLEIFLGDQDTNKDSQLIISKVRGARTSKELNRFFFQVRGVYTDEEYVGIPELYWGNELENLKEVPSREIFSELDRIFKIVYIDPTIELEQIFIKNKRRLFEEDKFSEKDKATAQNLQKLSQEFNIQISSMELISQFQAEITKEYKSLKNESIAIEMKSEISINGYFNDLIPYIKRDNDEQLYPTSGDGRKKILAYSLMNYLTKKQETNKIIIYLIEEPENSLHRSMQIALSKQLFEQQVYNYFFLSTHSAELLYEMDNASLIRIHSENQTQCSYHIYHLEDKYKKVKKKLNRSLATALFANKVLLVEGPSEKILFEKVLSDINPTYELDGNYLIEVDGIDFSPYVETLKQLNIKTIVKTDNDIKQSKGAKKKYEIIGINRCLKLLGELPLSKIDIDFPKLTKGQKELLKKIKDQTIINKKKELYQQHHILILKFQTERIFLSEIDLENDLYNVISKKMDRVFGTKNPIERLQSKKLINMIELVNHLTPIDSKKIYNSPLFLSLKELIEC